VLQHIRKRVVEALARVSTVTLSTYGPADIQAGVFACEAVDLTLYLLVPRTSDHLFNLEHSPGVVATTETWQLRGTARVAEERPVGLALLQRPDAGWCELIEIRPTRLQIKRSGGAGYAETFDID
jgi:hypothetical protein